MRAAIDYFFGLSSPWSYLGLPRLREFAQRSGSTIRYKPMALGKVFEATGGLPVSKRPPARRAYRMVELERWRSYLDVRLNLEPRHFPVDDSLAARTVIAADLRGQEVGALCLALHRVVWAEDADLADEAVIRETLEHCGLDARLVEEARSDAASERLEANTREAIERGVFGAPTYFIEEEMFWGQDRLDFVARKLGLSE
jgi:2-hydroxychromene-2-carboxylate isomerase